MIAYTILAIVTLGLHVSLAKQHMEFGNIENESKSQQDDISCPVWQYPVDVNGTETCQCYDHLQDIVRCNSSTREVAILDCYCMTANESNDIEVGKCLFNCERTDTSYDPVYAILPNNFSELNDHMCGKFNRQGRLCGECKDDHYPPSYSYSLKCIKCKGHYWYWLIYITAAFVPLTIFFILVVCLRISATSPQLNGYVVVAQLISLPVNYRVLLLAVQQSKTVTVITSMVASLYGIWNLDFFRMPVLGICLHLTTLQAIALDYVLALYPLILIALAYTFIQLQIHNWRVMSFILRPITVCFARIRNEVNAKTSLIDAFATFLLLSYSKVLNVSFDLLVPTQVYNATGDKIGLYLFYDASVEYFGKQHLPYAMIAIVISFVFSLLPLLFLTVYPMQCFQRLLGVLPFRFHALRIFMDSFQGCYKDGTNGTRDFRYFPAIYLLARIFLFIVYGLTLNASLYGIAALTLMVLGMSVLIVQPYKQQLATYNTVEGILILQLVFWIVTILCMNIANLKANHHTQLGFYIISGIVATLPIMYISFVALKWILTKETLKNKLKKLFSHHNRTQYEELQGNDSFLEEIDERSDSNEARNFACTTEST